MRSFISGLHSHSSAFFKWAFKRFGSLPSSLHSPSDVQPVKNSALNLIRLHSITYYRSLSRESAGGCGLTARQRSVAFYHLCHTGISTARAPDLDTWLAIGGSKALAACDTGQERRQNAHPAASDSRILSFHSAPTSGFVCWRRTGCTRSRRCSYHSLMQR